MSDDSDIEDNRRRQNMSSKRSKGKRSLSTGNEKGAKRRCLETTSTDKTKRGKPYDCKLCETAFNNVSSRNGHYSGKHKVHDEKLLFFPNGTGLVESSLEHQISLKPDWFKAAVRSKRRTTVCKLCEVDLDTEDHLNLHYKDIHKVTRMSVLSELIRLKNTDIKKVAVTHKCSFCTASFDDAQELESHMKSAHDADYKRCDYCNIRVPIDVYNAHIQKKHGDMIDKRVETRRSLVEVPEPKPKKAKHEKKVKAVKKVETPKREVNKDKVKKTKDQKVAEWCSKLVPAAKKTALTLYLCKACKLATASYDNAVSHAQDHILNLPTATNHCDICNLNFAADFKKHKKMHLTNEDLDADSFKLFPYDYRLLMSHKWFDMFVNSSKTLANKVRSASIYFPSRCIRLKMEKESKDPSEKFTLFMCVTCNKYVDPPSIELHVEQQGDCSNQLSCYLCYVCQRQFFSQKARDQHSSTHEFPDASKRYRTVLFNDRNDLICNKKLLQAGMNIVVTNNERVNKNSTENSESIVETDIITVVNEALYKADHVEKIENDVLNELCPIDTDNDIVADIYECKCGLSFDRLEFLCKHWKTCSPALKLVTKTCKCGLVFDKENYEYHCTVHSNGFTTFTVNEVSIRVKNSLDVRHIKDEFINTTELNNSEVIYNGMDEDNAREEDVNKDTQGRILQNLQVVNIANVKEVAANHLLSERPTLSNHVHQPVNYQQSNNELGSAEYIIKTQDDSKTVYEQFQTYKVFSNDISNNESQSELGNQVAMDVTDASINVQNDEVPDNTNVCSSFADENQSMVDTTMEIDLQQRTYQDKNLLISNTKMKEITHESVLHNANSVKEVRGVVEDLLDSAEITKEINTDDEATTNTEGDKADVQFADNKNKNTENIQKTSNEHDKTEFLGKTQANSQTADKEFEADKVLISNDISNKKQVATDVTDVSFRIQNNDVPDKHVCNNNADENKTVVDTSTEIDIQHKICQDKNLVNSVVKEIPHKKFIHNTSSVNEDSNVVENRPCETEVREESNTHDEAVINTQDAKVDIEFVDSKNKNTESYQETSNKHDSVKNIVKTQANSQTVEKEFEAHKMLISNEVGNNVSHTELEHQVALGVINASISIVNDGVTDDRKVCNNNRDENQSMVDTSMEIDLQQETYQDKNLLISNIKEQSSIDNPKPEKENVIPLLEENKVSDSVLKEISHENVLVNATIINEISNVVEAMLDNTEITKELNTHDEAMINTQGDKADVQFVDDQNNSKNYQQISKEYDNTKFIGKTQVNSPTVGKEFEAEKVLISNDISNNVPETELENHDDVPDNTNVCSSNADENQSMVDTTMEIDLQQETYQDKKILISNTKEQDSVENSKPVSPSLEENKLSANIIKEIPRENVLHNANSVNEVSGVVEHLLDNTNITKEINTHDEAMTNTQGDKADVQLVDNQNKKTRTYQQTSNEQDNQVNSLTVDKEFEADKVLISGDISNNVSQTELENEVAMNVTDASISVQNGDVPDKINASSNNAGEHQLVVGTSMEIDSEQEKYRDKNLLISKTKEHGSGDNSEPEKNHVSPSLEENKLIDSVMKEIPRENVLHNAKVSDVVDTLEESNTHDEAAVNTQELWAKEADVEFVYSKNKHTERDDVKSNDHPKDEENEREHIRTETQCAYNNEATEMVKSEEELLDGPEDPDVDESLLTDDEDL